MRRILFVLVLSGCLAAGCRAGRHEKSQDVAVEWHHVASWSGRGNAQLETFPIGGWSWRVKWETKNASDPQSGSFRVSVHSADSGRQIAEIIDVRGAGRDVAYVTELPHRYYLVVKSANVDWTMMVEEAVLK